MTTATTPRLATIPEVAKCLAISRASVYALMDRGELPYTKLGSSRRIPWAAVERLIQNNTVGQASV